MPRYVSRSREETARIARCLLLTFRDRHPLILALAGELGSGKTTFVQGIAASLGIREKIQSPTFVLARWYAVPTRARPFRYFLHLDAYRIEKLSEARHLGLPRMLKDRDAIVAIEWADRIRRFIPKQALWIRFQHGQHPAARIIRINGRRSKREVRTVNRH